MSTPDLPHGVLHVAIKRGPMEDSMWSWSLIQAILNVMWSVLGSKLEVKFFCHMEYSIWLFYDAIWNTSYGGNLRPYGVLHNVIKNV